jgi:hypothetical protein
VAQAVVDHLEVVQVQEQHAHRARRGRPRQRLAQAVQEAGAVGQPGQWVVEGLVAELVLEGAALGDVVEGGHQAGHAAVGQQVGHDHLDDAPGAAAVPDAHLGGRVGARLGDDPRQQAARHRRGMAGGVADAMLWVVAHQKSPWARS